MSIKKTTYEILSDVLFSKCIITCNYRKRKSSILHTNSENKNLLKNMSLKIIYASRHLNNLQHKLGVKTVKNKSFLIIIILCMQLIPILLEKQYYE